jgi:hypothetical protein
VWEENSGCGKKTVGVRRKQWVWEENSGCRRETRVGEGRKQWVWEENRVGEGRRQSGCRMKTI